MKQYEELIKIINEQQRLIREQNVIISILKRNVEALKVLDNINRCELGLDLHVEEERV